MSAQTIDDPRAKFLARYFSLSALEAAEADARNSGALDALDVLSAALEIRAPRRPGPFSRQTTE